jgi:hypothetical protein
MADDASNMCLQAAASFLGNRSKDFVRMGREKFMRAFRSKFNLLLQDSHHLRDLSDVTCNSDMDPVIPVATCTKYFRSLDSRLC